ncbi:TlpA family protein disulfide reductase [Sinomonas gamaensis]|uniref:TlpA family protein disulfide reductase n=1 Tax=Sinomonas gamaensis TaxID=2565624 RepID=UPI001109C4C0|nr:MauE/DoxX family redox-associated membrane protein [Sinomonas gamaensis]
MGFEELLAFLAAGCLSALYGVSGTLKLRSADSSARNARELGVAPRFASVRLIRTLACFELVLSAGFLLARGPVLTALGAVSAVVLSGFVWLLARAVHHGIQTPCPCFGSGGSVMSLRDVARNAALVVVSVGAGFAGLGGHGLLASLGSATLSDGVWMFCLAVAILGPAARSRRTEWARGSPRLTGRPVPDVELVAVTGHVRTLPQLVGGRPALMVFTKAGCGACEEAAVRAAAWADRLQGVTVMVATSADTSQLTVPEGLALHMLGAGAAREAFGVGPMPAAVLLSHDGTVASELVEGLASIEKFVDAVEGFLPAPH